MINLRKKKETLAILLLYAVSILIGIILDRVPFHTVDIKVNKFSRLINITSHDAYLLVVAAIGSYYSFFKNDHKKNALSIFIMVSLLNIHKRNWWQDNENHFLLYCGGIVLCLIIFFIITESLAKHINDNCHYKCDKVFIKQNTKSDTNTFLSFYDDVRSWFFMDSELYSNMSSVKTKILLRSIHYFSIMTFVILCLIVSLNQNKFEMDKLLTLVPVFFLMYFQLGTQHWNQWKYCVDQFNSLPKISEDHYDNKKYLLAIDIVVCDMWSNKALMGFFRDIVVTTKYSGSDPGGEIILTEREVLESVEAAQKSEVIRIRQKKKDKKEKNSSRSEKIKRRTTV